MLHVKKELTNSADPDQTASEEAHTYTFPAKKE